MNYQTFQPDPLLTSFVKCYWTLVVPGGQDAPRQRILPDGCIEMIFILGDDIRRYTGGDEYILQPRAMILGQITEPFIVEPTGAVHSFAVRFYPYGFANLIREPVHQLSNKETPLAAVFDDETAGQLVETMILADDTTSRIRIIETFLINRLQADTTVDNIVKRTVDALMATGGGASIGSLAKDLSLGRRQMERRMLKLTGISPKQLGRVIRLQATLKLLLQPDSESLTRIAYDGEYYDQAHFIKDFREFTGLNPGEFHGHENMTISSLFYQDE